MSEKMTPQQTEPSTNPLTTEAGLSSLLLDSMGAVEFMVALRENPTSFSNEEILAHFQKMVDDKVIDMLAASVTFCIELIKNGHIKRPAHYPPAAKPSSIILPPGAK
jgi:hypothetical protein